MQELKALNIYQINILQNLTFMYKVKNNLAPDIFQKRFTLNRKRKYMIRSSFSNLEKPLRHSKLSQFSISYRRPHLWNEITSDKSRNAKTLGTLKENTKQMLLFSENEVDYFI